jgi:DNA-binding XRE family transcriptional regulator
MQTHPSKKRIRKRPIDPIDEKLRFFTDLNSGQLDIPEAVRRMRKISGKTQPEYAKLIRIAPRVLIDLERGVGNPTLNTLSKIGKVFGLVVSFKRKTGPA